MRAIDLLEDIDPYEPVGYDAGGDFDIIHRTIAYMNDHCKPWLTATDPQRPVYRGTNTTNKVFVRAVRPDRNPRDTDREIHDLYNKLIELAGGIANRTNSAFVSSYRATANIYGNVRVAIPAGEFDYTWSPVWNDWYTGLTASREMLGKLMYPAERNELRKLYSYRFSHDPEDMLRSKEYGEQFRKLLYDINSYNPRVVQHTFLSNRNLKEAIDSGNEIMVRCDAILYIDPDFYFNRILPKYKENTHENR